MLERVTALSLLIVAIIHLLPTVGVLGSSRLAELYGVEISDPNLLVLMRHRAVLFAALGLLCLAAIFAPGLRTAVLAAGFLSVVSFLVLARGEAISDEVQRVVVADYVALAALLVGMAAHAIVRIKA